MKKTKFLSLLLILFSGFIAFTSCDSNDDPKPEPVPEDDVHHFVYCANEDQTVYVTTFQNFEEGVSSNFDNAIQLPSGHACMKVYDGHLYIQSGSMYGYGGEQTLYKYKIDAKGRLSEKPVAQLTFEGSPCVIDFVIASKTKAYGVTCGTSAGIVVFNPETMKETGRIDISKYGYGDKDPDAGNGIIRDGKLYLPLCQVKSMKELHKVAGQVAIIDIATDKVEKVIQDERVNGLGYIGHTNPVMDEAGNIYFLTGPLSAMLSLYMPDMGFKEGMVRIKKGETEFDKDFYISLQSLEGGEPGSYGMYMRYGGNNKIYIFLQKNSLVVDPEDQSYVKNKDYVPYEIDIMNRTGKILPLPATCGWAANALIKDGDYMYFGEQTETGIGFYGYNMKTGKGTDTPVVKTPVGAYMIERLNN